MNVGEKYPKDFQEFLSQSTTIITDGWLAYTSLSKNKDYHHTEKVILTANKCLAKIGL